MRWLLTLTYVALLALLLAAFGVYQFVALRQSLITSRVTSLQDDVISARALLARTGSSGSRLRALCISKPGGNAAGRAVAVAIAASSGHTVAVVVYDRALQVVGRAPAGSPPPLLDPATVERAVAGVRSAPREVVGAGGQEQLMVGFPLRAVGGGTVCGAAQLSTSMAPIDHVLEDEVALLVLGSAAALLVAAAAGLILTRRALRPLQRLTATSRRLAAGDLGARSGVERRQDEVGVLARSFDDMAERVEELFAAQQDSEERTRRFIADASHELRTPVTALKGYIDVIRRGATPDPASLDAALLAMAREADRMRALVLDLLTLARLDSHQSAPPEVLDVSGAISHLLDEGVPGMPARLGRQLQPGLLATVDPGALGTIVRNLLVNACTYAPGAAQAWRSWAAADGVHIEARDEGPGIAAADLPHVFERFYRGEKTRARGEGGSGLGLSIVKALATSQGGDVTITSSEGAGTAVAVRLRSPGPAATPLVPPGPPRVRG